MAANAAFSINDLKQFKSSIKYDLREGDDTSEAKPLEKEKPTSLVQQSKVIESQSSETPLPHPPIDPAPSNAKPFSSPEIKSPTLDVISTHNDIQQPEQQSQLSRSSTAEESVISTTLIFGQEDGIDASSVGQNDVQQQQSQQLSQSSTATPPTGQDGVEALSAGQDGIHGDEDEDQPLSERIVSKNWKVRLGALESLQKKFKTASDNNDPIFHEFGEFIPSMLCDSNSSCMDAALEAAVVYADRCSNVGSKAVGIAKSMVSYGFSGRASTVSASETLLLKVMEVCMYLSHKVGRKWCHLLF